MRKEWLDKDYYAELGVAKDASQKEIKKAFRTLARDYHPDNNPDDTQAETRFKEVNEAYETLSDEEVRKEYDHAREMGYFVGDTVGGQQYVRVEDIFGGGQGGSTQDLFTGIQDLFGTARRQRRPQKGADVSGSISLTFHEALSGVTKELSVGDRTVKVKIPKGVADGTRVRVKGKGAPGANGGPTGDLYVTVHVGTHPLFGRKGSKDLTIEVQIRYTEAALGAVISVPTLNGSSKIKIPAGTQGGTTMKLSGKGIETAKATGDLLVTLHVAVPTSISDDERIALKTLHAAEADWDPRSHLGA
ncbi:MAG: DnaJ C-terminal domain-containing protein [Actinomycetota bacterium]